MFIFQQNSFFFEYLLNFIEKLTVINFFLCLKVTDMLLLTIFFTHLYVKNVAKDFADITRYFRLISPSGYIAWFGEVILAVKQWS